MAWINLKNGDCIQTSTICNVRGFGTPTEVAIDLVNTETVCVDESREEIRALIAAAEEAEVFRNAKLKARARWVVHEENKHEDLYLDISDEMLDIRNDLAAATQERDEARAEAETLREFLKAHEAWEADLVRDPSAWGSSGMPVFTQAVYDGAMQLQAMRNNLLKGAE